MIVDAEFNEIEETTDELDLAQDDGLPWLESEEEDDRGGGVDKAQLIGFVAILLAVLFGVVALVYVVSNYNSGPAAIADGSTIEAPDGPYKVRPEDAGGKEFAGTGDVAPGVGQGDAPEARMADGTGAGSGEGNLDISMPPIAGGSAPLGSGNAVGSGTTGDKGQSAGDPAPQTNTAAPSSANTKGIGVQLAAYSSRARAEKGWRDLQRQSKALNGLDHRVVEGKIDIGTVYRLQAVMATRGEANALCGTLKNQGLDCQVKP